MTSKKTRVALRDAIAHPVHWFAFGFGTGLMPVAPATWGSLLAAIIFWFLPPLGTVVWLVLVAVLFAMGVWICGASARRLGVHDHSDIVWDEIVGMLATLTFVPREIGWIALAFLTFRVMDVLKPWPIRDVDHRLGGGLGIMLDDLLAALYAALTVYLLQLVYSLM